MWVLCWGCHPRELGILGRYVRASGAVFSSGSKA